jgi:uncharacterized protein YdhG (YjbR/CyaY superfamily)
VTIDEYLADLPDDQRAALERLRAEIRRAAPDAVETISYGRPAFRLDGRYFVGFGATKKDCSFYIGKAPLERNAAELSGYRLWKGTINFPPDRPLPAELVRKLVKQRVAEYRGT